MILFPSLPRSALYRSVAAAGFVVLCLSSYSIYHLALSHRGAIDTRRDAGAFEVTQLDKASWRRDDYPVERDYDIVVSYYDEDIDAMFDAIHQVVERLPSASTPRVVIYIKSDLDEEGARRLLTVAHQVVLLANIGREGETYLNHIIRHYDDIAEHTLFMQPHLAWHWVMLPRLEKLLGQRTGFLSLGPYLNQTCGHDSHGQYFPRMADIYSAFRGDLCPPEPVLGLLLYKATWAGQFVVSQNRVLANRIDLYRNLWAKFHERPDHWIWREGYWNNEASNPTLGHALERTWPVIFDCTDMAIALCGEGHGRHCQCLDR